MHTQEQGKGIYLYPDYRGRMRWFLYTEGRRSGAGFESPTGPDLIAAYIAAPGEPERHFLKYGRREIHTAIRKQVGIENGRTE